MNLQLAYKELSNLMLTVNEFCVPDQTIMFKGESENLKPVGSCEKLAKKPLSGLWPMEKFSMSKSINNMSMVALECSHPQSQSHFYDYDHAVNNWSKLTIEEKMISYLMKEYIESNRKKIFR